MTEKKRVPVRRYLRREPGGMSTASFQVGPRGFVQTEPQSDDTATALGVIPSRPGLKPGRPTEDKEPRRVRRFKPGEAEPRKRDIIKAAKRDVKKKREELRTVKIELKQQKAQAAADIAEAKAEVQKAAVDLRDAKETLRLKKKQ